VGSRFRRRLYDPPPKSLRGLPRERRRRIVRATRRGEQLDRRSDAKIALDVAEWMTDQARTSYLDLLLTPISLLAVVLLLVLGFLSFGHWIGAVANVIPFFGILLVVRGVAWIIFRNAPDAYDKNLAKVRRRR
jgi:hypothetical protein